MQIQIISGIYTDGVANFRMSYPRNLIPVPLNQGISNGYLSPAEGIVAHGTGPGIDRGGINWNGNYYRVMGTKLVQIAENGTVTTLGDVGPGGEVKFDYSFDRLSVSSNEKLFYWDGATFAQVTDTDLGIVLDHIYVDGYFMVTDGAHITVTELNDPFDVITTKYGSSEFDPDPVLAILKLRKEPQILNRYTIEVFQNIGGSGFPFQPVDGAQITRGTVGTHACCVFTDAVVFVGGGKKESIAVWRGEGGTSKKISTREIDLILAEYPETTLSEIRVESRVDKDHQLLYIHLPDKTLVYDAVATAKLEEEVWYTYDSGLGETPQQYRAKNLVYCFDRWLVGDPTSSAVGYLTTETNKHWGANVQWEFGTLIVYNEGHGCIFHELELITISGRIAVGVESTVWTQFSLDGLGWSNPRPISVGRNGQRKKRLVWSKQGPMRSWRIQRFFGSSDAALSIARLDARIEPLAV